MANIYEILSGETPVTDLTSRPFDLETAKRLAQEISTHTTQKDATISVRLTATEQGGKAAWRSTAAAFVNGEEVDASP